MFCSVEYDLHIFFYGFYIKTGVKTEKIHIFLCKNTSIIQKFF